MTGSYEIGYGKPPKASRWQKGQSGNPRGRPKTYKSAISVLGTPVNAVVNGKKCEVTAFEGSLRKTAQSAIEGRLRAIKRFVKHCDEAGLLVDPKRERRSGVYRVPLDPANYPHHDFTEEQLEEIRQINAGLNRPAGEDKPPSEKVATIRRVAGEKHFMPALGQQLTVLEIIMHKLRHRALIDRHETSHAYFEKLLTQTTVDLDATEVGVLHVPAGVPSWLSRLKIIDVDANENPITIRTPPMPASGTSV